MDETLKNVGKVERNDRLSFTDMIEMTYLTPENSTFSLSKNGFLQLVSSKDVRPERFGEEEGPDAPPSFGRHGGHGPQGGPPPFGEFGGGMPPHGARGGHGHKEPPPLRYTPDGRRDYGRVLLHRSFPFEAPDGMISVQTEDETEIGLIRHLSDFDQPTAAILREQLDKKYFVPEIRKILSTKDRYGFVYFTCETDKGQVDFVMRNPFGSILRLGENRLCLIDLDGNRYAIPDVTKLDRKSYRKIELYL